MAAGNQSNQKEVFEAKMFQIKMMRPVVNSMLSQSFLLLIKYALGVLVKAYSISLSLSPD